MDLNHIDMAMKAYLPKLFESEQERLRFFRTLWGVQAEVQKEHAAKVEHVVPDAGVSQGGFRMPSSRCWARILPTSRLMRWQMLLSVWRVP